MKLLFTYVLVAFGAILLGVGGAYLTHQYQLSTEPEVFYSKQWLVSDSSGLTSEAFFEYTDFDFGEIDAGQSYQHDFIVESRGKRDLEIWFEDELSPPFSLDLGSERVTIPRDGTYPITIRFEGSAIEADFAKSFRIRTNEAGEPERILTVRGRKRAD